MKRTISLLSALAFVLAFSGSAFAQQADVTASAEIVTSITVSQNQNLNFGQIESSQTEDATIDPNGTNEFVGSQAQYGKATIAADPQVDVTVTFSDLTELAEQNDTDGTPSTIGFSSNYTGNASDNASSSSDISDGATVTTGTDGNYYIYLGGTLTGGDISEGGLYSGTITVTADFVL